jgi:hypothetical protein
MSWFNLLSRPKQPEVLASTATDLSVIEQAPDLLCNAYGLGLTCVIANGIPKSGTHLLYEIVKAFGPWIGSGVHLNRRNFDIKDAKGKVLERRRAGSCEQLQGVRNGQVFPAHFPYRDFIAEEMAAARPERNLRHVLVVRDPRDAVVSRYKWYHSEVFLSAADQAEFFEEWRRENPDQSSQLKQITESYSREFLDYLPWMNCPTCLVLRYEDLLTQLSNLTNGPGPELKRLAQFLDLQVEKINWPDIARRSLHRGFTVSKEGGATGRFRQVLKPEHLTYFNDPEVRQGMEQLGYRTE